MVARTFTYPSFLVPFADCIVKSFSTLSDSGLRGEVHSLNSFEHSCGHLSHLMPSGVSWLICSPTMPFRYLGLPPWSISPLSELLVRPSSLLSDSS